ncbi:MAG: hypothetical protein Q9200_004108 [Gallowayella weberi]
MAMISGERDLTPPPDKEEDDEEARVLEAQARQDLENDGCPPCYPPHLHVPIQDPPEEYRRIIEYWESFSSTENVVLCAQRSDWQEFRQAQQRLRHRHRNKPFNMYIDQLRGRRRAHGLDDNVHLLPDPHEQSPQQNWIEFQDYHLRVHEQHINERDKILRDLVSGTDKEGSEQAPGWKPPFHRGLDFAERNLRWHEVMLSWIEQCRLAMDPPPPTPVEEGTGQQNPSSNPQPRWKRPNTSTVLDKVRVSKSTPKTPTPKSQNSRTRKLNTMIPTPDSVASAANEPSTIREMPKRREMKPRRAKEKALRQLLPQRVAKASRSKIKSPSKIQRSSEGLSSERARPQRRSATQRLHAKPGIIKARSPRVLKGPHIG